MVTACTYKWTNSDHLGLSLGVQIKTTIKTYLGTGFIQFLRLLTVPEMQQDSLFPGPSSGLTELILQ